MGSGFTNTVGGFQKALGSGGIDGAMAGDDERLGAYPDAADHLMMMSQVAAPIHQLIDRLHSIDPVDKAETQQAIDHRLAAFIADDRVDVAMGTVNDLYFAAKRLHDRFDVTELRRCDTGFFGNDHSGIAGNKQIAAIGAMPLPAS